MAALNFPFAASGTRRVPTADELANGYACGPLDKALDDFMRWWMSGQIDGAIEGAGLTTDDADLGQLLAAIRALTRDTARSRVSAERSASSQLTATDVITRVTGYGTIASALLGSSTFSGGILTIGAQDAGLWALTAHCRQAFASNSGQATYLYKNGTDVLASDGGPSAVGGWSIVHATAARIVPLVAGDAIDMRFVQTTGGNITFNDLYSFSAVRLGA